MNLNETYRVLGVMSGTSLDGIDFAICTFLRNTKWAFKIEKTKTIKYSKYWKKTLASLHKKNQSFILQIDIKYGKFLAKEINQFLSNEKVDFIASHGHTIFHQPEKNFTLQIGSGETIANCTRIKTINNFRNLDVLLGGQGAPLVPIGDLHLFTNYKYCVNLGGFANISNKKKNKIIAFDICPANIVLNEISKELKLEFDVNGEVAKKGALIPELLNKLNKISFYKQKAPKSLSREWVEKSISPLFLKEYETEDILHTFCEHIAIQIGLYLKKDSVLFTGGGVFNTYLMKRISYHTKSKIFIPKKKIINFKEALIFAFLGVLRVRNEINCLKSVTGAKEDNCGGEVNNPM